MTVTRLNAPQTIFTYTGNFGFLDDGGVDGFYFMDEDTFNVHRLANGSLAGC